jgi:uncharacterized membrane protein YccF (DUF307 family)
MYRDHRNGSLVWFLLVGWWLGLAWLCVALICIGTVILAPMGFEMLGALPEITCLR